MAADALGLLGGLDGPTDWGRKSWRRRRERRWKDPGRTKAQAVDVRTEGCVRPLSASSLDCIANIRQYLGGLSRPDRSGGSARV